ncbi:MAG: UbiA family prenyltransferase [Deltaproteobacteria bacterium]|nr:UbiA family prenyltransferase [Deltaproteobacteria bacterium]
MDDLEIPSLFLLLIGSLLLVAQIFLFNDWADIESDGKSRHRTASLFTTPGVSPGQMLLFSSCLGVAGLIIFACISTQALLLAVGVMCAGFAYSYPLIYTKGRPILSSLTHFVGQSLHFLLGYTLYSDLNSRGLMISVFFSLVFVGGHLNQEVRDTKGDHAARIRTNSTVFGKKAALIVSHILFTGAFIYLGVLAGLGIIPREMAYLVAPYLVYASIFWRTFAAELNYKNVTRLQTGYRFIFVLIGLGITAIRLLELLTTNGSAP